MYIWLMKKAILGVVLFVIVVGIYSFLTDFSLIKRLAGYNVPEPTDLLFTSQSGNLDFLNVPEGFKISIAARGLDSPRVILFDSKGRMLVSETKAGRISTMEDKDQSGDFETKNTLIENLKSPHGLALYKDFKQGVDYLYIAETHQVVRYPYDINTGKLTGVTSKNIAFLPDGGRHFTRTIAFGPNFRKSPIIVGQREKETVSGTKLYISAGSSCDVCVEQSWKRAAILESDPEGTFTAEFAGGLRNSVFFAFHPETKEIWATEMGRDNLGDDLPPDEVNIIKVAGPENKFGARRYGWPFCYGDRVKDKTFNPGKIDRADIPQDCGQTEKPIIEIPAHSAPLGLVFIPQSGEWPNEWKNNLLVAYHGSWNRSEPTGYKIVKFAADKEGKVSKAEDFITGWFSPNKKNIYGRPVDLKFNSDGNLFISDDQAGVIYKVESK